MRTYVSALLDIASVFTPVPRCAERPTMPTHPRLKCCAFCLHAFSAVCPHCVRSFRAWCYPLSWERPNICVNRTSRINVVFHINHPFAAGRLRQRYVSRARLRAARSHSFPPRRSYFASSASVTRSRIIAVCASSGGSAGRPRAFFGAGLFIAATQVFAQPEFFSRVQPLVALRARVG